MESVGCVGAVVRRPNDDKGVLSLNEFSLLVCFKDWQYSFVLLGSDPSTGNIALVLDRELCNSCDLLSQMHPCTQVLLVNIEKIETCASCRDHFSLCHKCGNFTQPFPCRLSSEFSISKHKWIFKICVSRREKALETLKHMFF